MTNELLEELLENAKEAQKLLCDLGDMASGVRADRFAKMIEVFEKGTKTNG